MIKQNFYKKIWCCLLLNWVLHLVLKKHDTQYNTQFNKFGHSNWDYYLIRYFLKNQLVFGTNWSHYLKACFLPTIHSHLASTPHWGQIWRPAIVNKTKRLSLIFLKYDKWQEEEKLFGIFFDPIFFLRFLCEIIQQ